MDGWGPVRMPMPSRVVWQYEKYPNSIGEFPDSETWINMTPALSDQLERHYQRARKGIVPLITERIVINVPGDNPVMAEFNFRTMEQWSHTHQIKRRMQRMLTGDAWVFITDESSSD